MRRVLALVVLAVIASGCADSAPAGLVPEPASDGATLAPPADDPGLGAPVRALDDAEGDATEHNSDEAAAAARQACYLVHASQRATCRDAIPDDRVGGVPAPAALDVVSLDLQESADAIVFRIGMADLSEDPTQFVDSSGQFGASVRVGYRAGTSCSGLVTFSVGVVPDAVYARAVHQRTHDACEPEPGDPLQGRCATSNACSIAVPWHIEPGTPGAIVVTVPRAQTALIAQGTTLEADVVVLRGTSAGIPGGWIQPGTDLGSAQFSFDWRIHAYVVDDTPWGQATLAAQGRADAWGEPVAQVPVEAAQGVIVDGDLDVVGVAIADDPRNFSITLTLRELPAAPDDLDLVWQMTTPGKHHYVIYGTGDGGEWSTSATRVVPDRRVPIASDIVAMPGTPGTLTIIVPRTELPGTMAGGLMRTSTGAMQRATQEDDPDGPTGNFYLNTFTQTGLSIVLPPYRFATDPAEAAALPAIEITDAVGDTAEPADAAADPSFREGRFDIAYATLHALTGQRIRLDLGIVGLDAIEVPTLYDGAFYGAGLQTDESAWMIVLVQDKATGTPTAICGPDGAFLTPDPKPPTAAAGVPVSYTLIPASGDAAALISFDVPAACLGIEDATSELPVSRLAARAGVIGNPVGAASASPVLVIDEAVDAEGGRLVFPSSTSAPSPWAEPFGISNFWDIVGVLLAILFAIITAALVIAKRVRMKRYLFAIEELADQHHNDPRRFAEALITLRQRLFADLLANRVTEGHFVMIEERLRSHLSSTRINAFGEAFYHLPPAFMIRLQTLLADGRFSTLDHRSLTEFLTRMQIPEESRAAVLAQLDVWAAQDQVVTRMTRLARSRRGWRRLMPQRAKPAEAIE